MNIIFTNGTAQEINCLGEIIQKCIEEENFVTANYTDWVQIYLYQNGSNFIIKYISYN